MMLHSIVDWQNMKWVISVSPLLAVVFLSQHVSILMEIYGTFFFFFTLKLKVCLMNLD